MNRNKMYNKIKLAIDIMGLMEVASRLGYRSPWTLSHWLKNKKIPGIATDKVLKFLKENESVLHGKK